MNKVIEKIFKGFTVDNVEIPVEFLTYKGKSTTYITYFRENTDTTLSGDDELINYIDYYDFHIYSKENYKKIVQKLKKVLKENDFIWQPSRSSADMFEADTGYYHIVLNFAIINKEE